MNDDYEIIGDTAVAQWYINNYVDYQGCETDIAVIMEAYSEYNRLHMLVNEY